MTEICYQVFETVDAVKEKLREAGFIFSESYDNHDSYFTRFGKEEAKNLEYKKLLDSSLIVRWIKSENWEVKNILHKTRILDKKGNVISEEKTKIACSDTIKAKMIFIDAGLNCWCDFVVQNNEYKKDDIIINLQVVDNLGVFIEIEECDSIKNYSDNAKLYYLKEIIQKLKIETGEDFSCKKPYMFLNR
ncbi:MAG: hypothetical protein FWE53_01565 [Firmicutes bacterium]|nr:hypothetical protein [Bacillota bacterium]